MNYYNEFDTKTAAWLRELISAKLIPAGDVDTRSIVDVSADELRGYTQCHFFAGIGGWSLALQLAGWPATRPVWTGSCPCQPFSTAGKGLAQADERHLWPVFFNLIKECRPEYVIGEQVASAIGKGWLDGISTDLGEEGYACGSAVLGAHSVGSPHIRQRLYWVAHTNDTGSQGRQQCDRSSSQCAAGSSVSSDRLAHTESIRSRKGQQDARGSVSGGNEKQGAISVCGSSVSGVGDTRCESDERWGESGHLGCTSDQEQGEARQREWSRDADCYPGKDDHWSNYTTILCRDNKTRRIPTEPAFFPLAHGIPARVVRLRGYGNAIVPQAAAEFIQAFQETQAATA